MFSHLNASNWFWLFQCFSLWRQVKPDLANLQSLLVVYHKMEPVFWMVLIIFFLTVYQQNPWTLITNQMQLEAIYVLDNTESLLKINLVFFSYKTVGSGGVLLMLLLLLLWWCWCCKCCVVVKGCGVGCCWVCWCLRKSLWEIRIIWGLQDNSFSLCHRCF